MVPSISCFVPVYNEAEIIESSIKKIYQNLARLKEPFEIFIVDDASTDITPQICQNVTKKYKSIIYYLRYNRGPSKRENLARSFFKARGNIIISVDADISFALNNIETFIIQIKKGQDIVIGSRYLPGARVKRRLSRLLISILYNIFIRKYFHSHLRDHHCGLKVFRREVILKLVKEMGYDDTFRRGWFWDAEMLIRAQKEGYKIKEIPVIWYLNDTKFRLREHWPAFVSTLCAKRRILSQEKRKEAEQSKV